MIVSRDVRADDWQPFGSAFSRVHRGWITEAWRISPSGAQDRLWEKALLDEVALGVSRAEARGDGAAIVTAVTTDARYDVGARLRAIVSAPTGVALLETEDGRHAGLRIVEASGATTELRFRVEADPAELDGYAQDPPP